MTAVAQRVNRAVEFFNAKAEDGYLSDTDILIMNEINAISEERECTGRDAFDILERRVIHGDDQFDFSQADVRTVKMRCNYHIMENPDPVATSNQVDSDAPAMAGVGGS